MSDLSERLQEAKDLGVHGKYADAKEMLSSIIRQKEHRQSSLYWDALNERGVAKRMLRDYESSHRDFLEVVCSEDVTDRQLSVAHIGVADLFRVYFNDFPSAHTSLDEALTYAVNGSLEHVKAVDQRGLVFVAQEDNYSAIAAYESALEICEDLLNDTPEDAPRSEVQNRYGQVLHHIGVAYVRSNNPELIVDAYDSQFEALEVFKEQGDQQGIVNTLALIGQIALIKDDIAEAIDQFEGAYGILHETGYDRAITGLSLDLAEAYLTDDKPDQAIGFLERFRDGVVNHQVTEHDLGLMDDQFRRTLGLYHDSPLNVEGFEKVVEIFEEQ